MLSGVLAMVAGGVAERLTPGSAALLLLVREMTPEKVRPHIHEHGHVIQTSLSDRVEAQLDAALAAASPGPPRFETGRPMMRSP